MASYRQKGLMTRKDGNFGKQNTFGRKKKFLFSFPFPHIRFLPNGIKLPFLILAWKMDKSYKHTYTQKLFKLKWDIRKIDCLYSNHLGNQAHHLTYIKIHITVFYSFLPTPQHNHQYKLIFIPQTCRDF